MDSNSNSTGLIDSHYFGVALVAARMSRGISQSRLGILAACNVTSLRKIEKGMVQPGVSTAIRLVAATGESVGAFFQKLAEDSALSSLHGTAAPGSSCASPHEDDAAERTCDGTLMDRSGRKGRREWRSPKGKSAFRPAVQESTRAAWRHPEGCRQRRSIQPPQSVQRGSGESGAGRHGRSGDGMRYGMRCALVLQHPGWTLRAPRRIRFPGKPHAAVMRFVAHF